MIERRAVWIAVRRLRFGILIQSVAGDMADEVAKRELRRLADFARTSGLDQEAEEIMDDLSSFDTEGEPWAATLPLS